MLGVGLHARVGVGVLVDGYSRVGTNWSTFCVHACKNNGAQTL